MLKLKPWRCICQGRHRAQQIQVFGLARRVRYLSLAHLCSRVGWATKRCCTPYPAVEAGTQVYTDEYVIYSRLETGGYNHKTVNHGAGEYACDEDGFHPAKHLARILVSQRNPQAVAVVAPGVGPGAGEGEIGCGIVHRNKPYPCSILMLCVSIVIMIKNFRCPDTEKLYAGARVPRFTAFSAAALRKLAMLNRAEGLADLRIPPGNRLEPLQGDRAGQYSIRVNAQWRICFEWREGHVWNVEIVDYH